MKKSTRLIVAVRGDTHAGHSMGLMNPDTKYPDLDISEDGQVVIAGWHTPGCRPIQKRLWEWHEQDRAEISALAGKDPIVLVEMGDLTQGIKYLDDVDNVNIAEQVFGAYWNLAPWMEMGNVNAAFLVNGTASHSWGPRGSESLLTELLKKQYQKKRGDRATLAAGRRRGKTGHRASRTRAGDKGVDAWECIRVVFALDVV